METNEDVLITVDPETGELSHHGVKGMKWGVRKVPQRVGNRVVKKTRELKQRRAIQKKRIVANNNRASMSDRELNQRINRLEREKRLNDLTRSEVTAGRNAAKRVLITIGTTTVTAAGIGAGKYAVKKAIERGFGEDIAKQIIGKKK